MHQITSCKRESTIKRKANTKVDLKTNPSSPRLENEVKEFPQTLPKPTPFTCKRIRSERETATTICSISSVFRMKSIIYQFHLTSQ